MPDSQVIHSWCSVGDLIPEALIQWSALGQPQAELDLQRLSLLHSLAQILTVLDCLHIQDTKSGNLVRSCLHTHLLMLQPMHYVWQPRKVLPTHTSAHAVLHASHSHV